jgi:hypothetical protein
MDTQTPKNEKSEAKDQQ